MCELYYRDGTIKAAMTSREAQLMPLYRARDNGLLAAYTVWFDNYREAKAFLAEVLAAKDDQAKAGRDVNYLVLVQRKTDDLLREYYEAETNGKGYKTYAIGLVLSRRGLAYSDYQAFVRERGLVADDGALKGVAA
jgi:hypothetical protein